MPVTYEIEVLEEDIPVRGYAIASGDPAVDKAAEDEIIARLDQGDTWAWCTVRVVASIEIEGERFVGDDYLGACSYADEDDFRQGGYFESMKERAHEDLTRTVRAAIARGDVGKRALRALGVSA